jgi:nucleotide-binding universal stress UspA family protein
MNVLIVALDADGSFAVGDHDVLVVAPALNSRLRHWLSDEDGARRRAGERAAACVERLERAGAHARASVGDADPVQAIADALATFPADEVVIAADAERWHELAFLARKRFALPILQAEEAFSHAA